MSSTLIEQVFDQTTPYYSLQWNDEYATEEFLASVLAKADQVTNAVVARKIGFVMQKFVANADGKKLATTIQVYHFLIEVVAAHTDTPESIEWVALCILGLLRENPEGVRLFSTSETITALNKFAQVATGNGVRGLISVVTYLLQDNPEAPRLCTPAFIAALGTLASNGSSEITGSISTIMSSVMSTPDGRLALIVPEIALTFANLVKHVTSPASTVMLCSAICNIVKGSPTGLTILATTDFVDELKKLEQYATTPWSKPLLEEALQLLSKALPNQEGSTPAVPSSPTAPPQQTVAASPASQTTQSDTSVFLGQLFDQTTPFYSLQWKDEYITEEFLASVLAKADQATNAEVAKKIGFVMQKFAANADGKKLATTIQVYQFLIEVVAAHTDAPESVEWIAFGIAWLLPQNPEGQRFFSTPETFSAMSKFAQLATGNGALSVATAVTSLTQDNPEAPRLCTPAFIAALGTLASNGSAEVIGSVATVLGNIANAAEGRRALTVPEIALTITNLAKKTTAATNVHSVASAICNIVEDNPTGLTILATPDFVDELKKLEQYATTPWSKPLLEEALQLLSKALPNQEGSAPAVPSSPTAPPQQTVAVSPASQQATQSDTSVFLGQLFDQTTPFYQMVCKADCANESFVASVVAKPDQVTNATLALKLGWFFHELPKHPNGKKSATTSEVYQFFVGALAQHATTPDSAQWVAFGILGLLRDNPEGMRLFSTPETVAALNRLVEAASTNSAAVTVCSAVQLFFVDNPEAARLCTPTFVAAMNKLATNGGDGVIYMLSLVSTAIAGTPDGQRALSTPDALLLFETAVKYSTDASNVLLVASPIVRIVTGNPAGLAVFATPDFVDELKKLEKYATTPEAAKYLNDAVQLLSKALPNQEGSAPAVPSSPTAPPQQTVTASPPSQQTTQSDTSVFLGQLFDQTTPFYQMVCNADCANESFVASVVAKSDQITNATLALKLGWFFHELPKHPNGKKSATTSEVYQFFVGALAQHATTPDSAQWVAFGILGLLRDNPEGMRLFSTPETITALNRLAEAASTNSTAGTVCSAVQLLFVDNPEAARLCTPTFVAAMNKLATNGGVGVIYMLALVSTAIAGTPDGQRALSTPDALLLLGTLVKNSPDASNVLLVAASIVRIVTGNPDGLAVFATPDFVDELKKLEKYATTPEAAKFLNDAVQLLSKALPSQVDQKSTVPPPQVTTTQQEPSPPPVVSAQQQQQQQATTIPPPLQQALPPPQQQCASTTAAISSTAPPMYAFKRGVPDGLSFNESVAACLSLRELPKDEKGTVTRPDLADYIPDEHDLAGVLSKVEEDLPNLKKRKSVQDLIANNGITDDDIKALWIYKAENPYPTYKWLNAHMMGQRRDDKIKQTIGPLFVRIYRAMEKLPKIKCKVSRGALVRNIPSLRSAFDNYETRFKPGEIVSFWGFGSFSREDSVGGTKFAGDHDQEAIVYSCPEMEGVDMEPFAPSGMPPEAEILPMCPAVFESTSSVKIMNTKLVIILKQLSHEKYAYVVPHSK